MFFENVSMRTKPRPFCPPRQLKQQTLKLTLVKVSALVQCLSTEGQTRPEIQFIFYHLCSPSNLSNIRTRSAHFLQNPLFTLEPPKRHVGHFTCVCLRPEHKQRRTAVNAFQHCFNSFKNEAWIHTSPPYPALSAAATRCHCGLFVLSFPFFHLPPLQTVDSLSNRKQMGDLCCGLLPNGANSHYNVCKLCLFSPSLTSTPCTTLPSDVFNTCFRCRRVILLCLVLLITGYLSPSAQNGKNRHHLFCGAVQSDLFHRCWGWVIK